ncbi:MAG: hypothetical protein AB1640_11180 [bacterium]
MPVSFTEEAQHGRESGMALLIVIFIVTLLTAMIVSFADTTQKHLKVTVNYKNRLQAYWTAQSGMQMAAQLLTLSAQQGGGHHGLDNACWHSESPCYQELVLPRLLVPLPGSNSFMEPALSATTATTGQIEASTISRCPIVDENRKLSLYDLFTTQKTDADTFHRLVYLLEYLLTEEDLLPPEERTQSAESVVQTSSPQRISLDEAERLAGYLVDWVDTEVNSSADLNTDAAEEACPADGKPYLAKNGLLDSVEEIAQVCGFRQMAKNTIQKLTQHLTVYPVETNINTATLPVLHAFCALADENAQEAVSEQLYNSLHSATTDTVPPAFESKQSIADDPSGLIANGEVAKELKDHLEVKSDCFRVALYGLVRDPETGLEEARARVEMVLNVQAQNPSGGLGLLYYRED